MAKSWGDTLRDSIRASKKSGNQIAKETGVPQFSVSRFLAGADIRLSSAEKLAAYFGFEFKRKRGKRV